MMELWTLQEFRSQMCREASGHILVIPGTMEAFRDGVEGLEKTPVPSGLTLHGPRGAPDRWRS